MKEYAESADKDAKEILLQEQGRSAYSLLYAIDRNEDDLTRAQITKSALEFLTKKDEGFFMMIEGGMIDWAAHSNDGATVFEEVKDMDDAVKIAYDFYLQHPDSTLIVITADHETGGLGLGVEGYTLNLDNFQYQKLSQSGLSKAIQKLRDEKKSNLTWDDLKTLISDKTGLWNKIDVTKHQEKEIRHEFDNMMSKAKADTKKTEYSEDSAIAALVVKIMNRDAKVGWTSNTHTAALVPVFAIGAGAEEFVGLMENTDVPKRIQKAGGY